MAGFVGAGHEPRDETDPEAGIAQALGRERRVD